MDTAFKPGRPATKSAVEYADAARERIQANMAKQDGQPLFFGGKPREMSKLLLDVIPRLNAAERTEAAADLAASLYAARPSSMARWYLDAHKALLYLKRTLRPLIEAGVASDHVPMALMQMHDHLEQLTGKWYDKWLVNRAEVK